MYSCNEWDLLTWAISKNNINQFFLFSIFLSSICIHSSMADMRFVMVLEQRIHPNFFSLLHLSLPSSVRSINKAHIGIATYACSLYWSLLLLHTISIFHFQWKKASPTFIHRSHSGDNLPHQHFVSKKCTFDSLPHKHRTHDALPHRRQHDWLLAAHSAPHSHKANTLHV